MKATFPPITVADSGWRPGDPASQPAFRTEGRHLVVELRRWTRDDIDTLAPPRALGEELAAVLEGEFELVAGDERHVVAAGNGMLIPPGEPRTWRLRSEAGVLYRVFLR